MTQRCGVCQEQQSKYNCPHCSLRYCSVKCFKAHIVTHEDDDKGVKPDVQLSSLIPERGAVVAAVAVAEDEDGNAVRSTSKQADELIHQFEEAQGDKRLKLLFVKYPTLRSQLKGVFETTLQPADQHQAGLLDRSSAKDFNRRPSFMTKGKWTQEKADRLALEKLTELAASQDGVNEFVELCTLLLSSENSTTGT